MESSSSRRRKEVISELPPTSQNNQTRKEFKVELHRSSPIYFKTNFVAGYKIDLKRGVENPVLWGLDDKRLPLSKILMFESSDDTRVFDLLSSDDFIEQKMDNISNCLKLESLNRIVDGSLELIDKYSPPAVLDDIQLCEFPIPTYGISLSENRVFLDSQTLLRKGRISLKRRRLMSDIIASLKAHAPGASYRTIAKQHKTTVYMVRKVWLENVIKTKRVKKRKTIDLPSHHQYFKFLREKYFQDGAIADNWNAHVDDVVRVFAMGNQRFKKKSIAQKLRRTFKVKALKVKRRPYKLSFLEYSATQTILSRIVLCKLLQDEPILFFDSSSIQLSDKKKTMLGTREMPPFGYQPAFTRSVHITAAISVTGFIAIQFSDYLLTGTELVNFLESSLHSYASEIGFDKPISVLLDNAGYQKISAIHALTRRTGAQFIYNIPCSPFNNLIEDFFLRLKAPIRKLDVLTEAIVLTCLEEELKKIAQEDFWWIVRKFGRIIRTKALLLRDAIDKRLIKEEDLKLEELIEKKFPRAGRDRTEITKALKKYERSGEH